MRNLLVALALSIPFLAQAQEFSAGARTGIGKNFFARAQNWDAPCKTTWDKQGFVRYESKKRFALEIGTEHYSYQYKGSSLWDDYFEEQDPINNYWTTTSSNTVFYLSAQYDIMCRQAKQSCPLFKNMKSYIGIVLAPVSVRERTINESNNLRTGETINSEGTYNFVAIMGGINHTLSYKFSEHLTFSSVLSYKLDFVRAFDKGLASTPASFENHIGYQIGAGYTF